MRLAIIPARGGSKRIPQKNIRNFLGKPIIAYAIETAKASSLFDAIWVSTDDSEIAEVAETYGAIAPFIRPQSLADDYATTLAVMQHAVKWSQDNGYGYDEICCLYATTPLLKADDLVLSHQLFAKGHWDYVFAAAEYAAPIFRAFHIVATEVEQSGDGGIAMFFPEHENTRSQDLPQALHDAGLFYWGQSSCWLSQKPIFTHHSMPSILPRWRVCDIDTPEDWEQAEIMAQSLKNLGKL